MAKSITELVDEVIQREGGYSNHPADRGGPTRWGVTEKVARKHGYRGDMKAFPRTKAVEIYTAVYWEAPNFHRVAEIYPAVGSEMFDTGINMGTKVAARFLQRSLNALNRNQRDFKDLKIDGDIGTRSLVALGSFKRVRGSRGEKVLVKALDALQGARYIKLAVKRPANEAFLYGWLANRVGQDV